MRLFLIILMLAFLSISLMSQSKFGIEIKSENLQNYNSGEILRSEANLSAVVIEKEYNVVTYSYGLGLSYFINANNLIKLSISRHQNGRLFDLTVYSDNLSSDSIEKSGVPFYYIQYCPSFTHRIMKNKFILPIEVGFNINKRIKEEELFYVVVKEHNYDVFFSTGLQYPILNDLLLGVNAKFNFVLNNYLDPRFYIGSYKPIQFGLQVSIMYQFL